MYKNLTEIELVATVLRRHAYSRKGLTIEEIAKACNMSKGSVRSAISILRNKHMEEIIDDTFVNENTGFRKKRYRYTFDFTEFKNWRIANRAKSEGCKLGRPMYKI
tara:strand:+ start:71 stop:388 length:318 start_codon:yes stop_codon:yes gene_type:complete